MKILILITIAIGFVGCGDTPRSKSVLCFLKESFVACHDKDIERMLPEPIPGKDGKNGTDGKDGINGLDGQNGETGPKGDVGEQGPKGDTGEQGEKGDKGDNGTDGTLVEVVFPCGESSIAHSEILLKIDGVFIAYFQNLTKHSNDNFVTDVQGRLTVLEENTLYQVTDGSSCKFRIVNGQVVVQ